MSIMAAMNKKNDLTHFKNTRSLRFTKKISEGYRVINWCVNRLAVHLEIKQILREIHVHLM